MGEKLLALLVVALLIVAFVSRPPAIESNDPKKFSSQQDLELFLKKSNENKGGFYEGILTRVAEPMFASSSFQSMGTPSLSKASSVASDFSATNIQVQGVDEADITKNDGKYIYTVSDGKVIILEAHPAESANILSKIEIVNGSATQIFVNGDRLVVFGNSQNAAKAFREAVETSKVSGASTAIYRPYYSSNTFAKVYDISDRKNPVLKRDLSFDGNYFNSRMIGDYVYLVSKKSVYSYGSDPIQLPRILENGNVKTTLPQDISYFDFPDYSYSFTTISAINAQKDSESPESKTFLLGYSQEMYVSQDNIYIVYEKKAKETTIYERFVSDVVLPLAPPEVQNKIKEVQSSNATAYERFQKISDIFKAYIDSLNPEKAAEVMNESQTRIEKVRQDIAKETEKTIIHKISISGKNIEYKNNGEVPGRVLNQFSMDEHKGFFRIATTTGEVWRENSNALNHVYVLDKDLKIVGKLEDLAHGERIYSVRFLGDRGYIVTFKKVDPLFAIDLSMPTEPKVLGQLKIPGFSEYLHPYDENHLIGVGKDAVAAQEGNFAWYQGVKLSLFDVSDPLNPKEISKFNIGDRGTDSDALRDHKAFLFSKNKNLLVIPVSLHEIDREKYAGEIPANTYGEFVWQGAYVFNLDLEKGFVLKGRITHDNKTAQADEYQYRYGNYQTQIKRSLYIGDVLYTISKNIVKASALADLKEIIKLEF